MKLQTTAGLVDLAKVWVQRDSRQRREIKVEDLKRSIERRGMLNPIIIKDDFELKAGERRLTACLQLGHTKILARRVSDLSPVEAQILELEENIKRQDLEWQELVRAVARIHQLYSELEPESWTQDKTAEECGLTKGSVSLYLSVHEQLDEERVAKASTVREAFNLLKRRSQRQSGVALQELLEGPDLVPQLREDLSAEETKEVETLRELGEVLPPRLVVLAPRTETTVVAQVEAVEQASFLDWAPQYSGPKFNLLHCDFPYGVNFAQGPQGRSGEISEVYDDSAGVYQALLGCLCENLDRVMSYSGHIMFWLSADTRIVHDTLQTFARLAPSISFAKFPLIWVKSDNAGIASDPRHGPRHIYELCLLGSRGQRQIARVKSDAYHSPIGAFKHEHVSVKPAPMLRHFMEMLVDESTSLLDPTCGSGASLRAADSLGAERVLGLEIDHQYIAPARAALRAERAKRAAAGRQNGLDQL